MAKGKMPPFMKGKKAPPVPQTAKRAPLAREAKAEGEPLGVEQQEAAAGFRRGGHVRRK